MGGFAMGALGIARATMDLAFLVHRADLDALDSILAAKATGLLIGARMCRSSCPVRPFWAKSTFYMHSDQCPWAC